MRTCTKKRWFTVKDAHMYTETLIYCKGCVHVQRNVDLL